METETEAETITAGAREILDLLPRVADQGWTVAHDGAIRNADGACPLCALGKKLSGEKEYRSFLAPSTYKDVLPVREHLRARLALAADNDYVWAPLYRPAMLRALGLSA